MNGLPPERKERLLIRLIGAAILLIVLTIAYLTYRTLPAPDPDATVLPASTSAPSDEPQPESHQESAAPPAEGSAQGDPSS